jgi:hypothetical protein
MTGNLSLYLMADLRSGGEPWDIVMADYGHSDSVASRRKLENDYETIEELDELPISPEWLINSKRRVTREDHLGRGIEKVV